MRHICATVKSTEDGRGKQVGNRRREAGKKCW